MDYAPPRQTSPKPTGEPLEVDLVLNVRPCGTCSFFWPQNPTDQPYGPYPAYDFGASLAPAPDPPPDVDSFKWVVGTTRPQTFPNPEVMDGCRKAPIMTVGINPNLTAFAPGLTGTSWCYPNFASDDGTDEWAKYAYYYRYRSVFQERFDLSFVEQYLLPEPRVVAPRAGSIVAAVRTSAAPSYTLKVRYDGDLTDTEIPLDRETGTPRWVLLVDSHAPNNTFASGATLAAQLDVPAGVSVDVYREQIGYYEQFVPTLATFDALIRSKGYAGPPLRMGEDVCQLDMVACASPHWTPAFLGGTSASEATIVDNCVRKNAWVIRQLVQTRPAVLYLVGESSYDMFRDAFGALIDRDSPLSGRPSDGAFTLLRETSDPDHPSYIRFETTIDGAPYRLETRLVVTPHFSYSTNFTPQVRLSRDAWQQLQSTDPDVANLLQHDERVTFVPPAQPDDYYAFMISKDASGLFDSIARVSPAAVAALQAGFYDAHAMMADVLASLYDAGTLAHGPAGASGADVLTRTEGSCQFCVNDRWTFPQGCPYGKNLEPAPPAGLLEKVTAAFVAAGRPPA